VALTAGVVGTAIVGAPLAAAIVRDPAAVANECPSGTRAETLSVGASLRVVDTAAGADELDEVDAGALAALGRSGLADLGPRIRAGDTVLSAVTARGNDRVALLRGSRSVDEGDVLHVCATVVDTQLGRDSPQVWPSPYSFEVVRIRSVRP
jgi:hypothetical protein